MITELIGNISIKHAGLTTDAIASLKLILDITLGKAQAEQEEQN
jgi:hypothetical protein